MSSDKNPSLIDEPDGSLRRVPLHRRIFHSGVAILVAGLIGSACIYLLGAGEDRGDFAIDMGNRRASEFQIERLGGMATVYVARFNLWFSGLWHGKQLAFTVAVLAVLVASACFWLAHFIHMTPPRDGAD